MYPVVATQGKRIGPPGTGRSSPVRRAERSRKDLRLAPPPPGFAPRGNRGSIAANVPKALDPTTITSITKTWVEASQSWEVQIAWTGGAAPYSLVKSMTPSFEWGVQTVGKEISGNTFSDQIAKDFVDNVFYNVTDLSVISPAVDGRGYEPEPAPGPPSLANPFGWWGSEMQLYASYLDPIAPANLSFSNRQAEKAFETDAPSGSSYSTWAKFVVPWDARTSIPATIQAHARMSPGASSIVLTPSLSYTDIHGVVWAPQTGNVWVADDNLVAEVDLFLYGPESTSRVTDIPKPYISQVSGNGILVVVDGSLLGIATVYQVDVANGGKTVFAQTHDDEFTRDIQPVGIALSPDGQICYIADGSSGKVVKIPAGAGPGSTTIKDAWGGKSDFVFADTAAIDVSLAGQVLVVNNGDRRVWQLVDENTGTAGDFVGSGIHVLAIDRELSTAVRARYVYTSAPAAAEAFNLNTIAPDPPAYHGSRVYGATDHLELYPEDREGQIYTIKPRDPQRVIISSSGGIAPYTSPLQVADRVIGFTVDGWQGLELHLELIDPPDTAAYAPDGGWDYGQAKKLPYEANDNGEDLQNADVGLSLSPTGPWAKKLNVTPASGGTATVYLKVTDRFAGDNYQVEVMKCVPTGCGAAPTFSGVLTERVVGLSPIFTAWKRIYIERDKMFRRGGVLAEDYLTEDGTCGGVEQDPCCGDPETLACDQVKVFRWDEVSAGDWIVLFDLLESLPDYSFFFERIFPVRLVLTVSDPDPDGFRVVTFDEPLERNFRAPSMIDTETAYGFQPNFSNLHTAGFGVVSGCDLASAQLNGSDSCFFEVDLRGLENPYADAFVEIFAPRRGISFVPYLPDEWFTWQILDPNPPLIQPWDNFSQIWFDHRSEDPSNYRHFVGAGSTTRLGMTTPTNYHWTYLFRGSIEDAGAGHSPEEVDHFTQHTTAHELGHHFNAQFCSDGHHHNDDVNPVEAWCEEGALCPPFASPQELCIMNNGNILGQYDQSWDSFFQFDVQCLFSGDDDPFCVDPPGPEPAPGSIRGVEDPLF